MRRVSLAGAVVLAMIATTACQAADAKFWGLKDTGPTLKSAGSLAFGPDGILFVGDAKAATVYAVDTGEAKGEAKKGPEIKALNAALSQALGGGDVAVNDLAVHPQTGAVYLSVTADGKPGLARVTGDKVERVSLEKAAYSKVALPNPPADKVVGEGRRARNHRMDSVTDLAYMDGKVLISGVGEGSASTVREVTFPFSEADPGANLEIFHGAHGRVEDDAAVRTFVPFTIDGEPNVLAGFTCTPLVRFPLSKLAPGKKTRGVTVAELGNRNRPLDMIVYEKGGETYLLMANSARGVMKISTKDIGRDEGINERVAGGGTAGQEFEKIEQFGKVVQLDRLNDDQAVVIVEAEDGAQQMKTVALP